MAAITNDGLFQATVPVFQHYIQRIDAIVGGLVDDGALAAQLAPDTFTTGEHFASAQGFALRTLFPLMDRAVPTLSTEEYDASGLRRRGREIRDLLAAISPSDMCLNPARRIHHRAGFADLTQDATQFVTLYALPNFFFHATMGYATLRANGVPLGKADFDGLHAYPAGFSFTNEEPS